MGCRLAKIVDFGHSVSYARKILTRGSPVRVLIKITLGGIQENYEKCIGIIPTVRGARNGINEVRVYEK